MWVPSLQDTISEHLARQIGFATDAILRQYGLGEIKTLDDAYDAIWYGLGVILAPILHVFVLIPFSKFSFVSNAPFHHLIIIL